MGEDDQEYADDHEAAEQILAAMKEAITQATEDMDSDQAARASTLAARQLAEEYGHIIQEPDESEAMEAEADTSFGQSVDYSDED
jgi:hypothetical protein